MTTYYIGGMPAQCLDGTVNEFGATLYAMVEFYRRWRDGGNLDAHREYAEAASWVGGYFMHWHDDKLAVSA